MGSLVLHIVELMLQVTGQTRLRPRLINFMKRGLGDVPLLNFMSL